MTHICIITTGGTIDSVAKGASLSVEATPSDRLARLMDTVMDKRATHETLAPLNKNSEDFSLHDIEAIADAIDRKAGKGNKLFIVTHGSDTLHFTAAALGLIFGGRDISICMVAAFRPLFDKGSDGPDNLKAAVAWLLSAPAPSTYVALKQDIAAAPVQIADWRDVKPLDFDSFGLASFQGRHVSHYTQDTGLDIMPDQPRPAMPQALQHQGLGEQNRHVRFVAAYVGLDAAVLADLAAGADTVIISAYHSGTVPSSDDPDRGITGYVNAQPDKLFLLCRHPAHNHAYASVTRFEAAGGMAIGQLLPHQAYMLACLLKAGGQGIKAIRATFGLFSRH